MEHQSTKCPSCGNSNLKPGLQLEDWFLSKEPFSLAKCDNCSLLVTQPVPDLNTIGKYYKSEEYISHSESGGLVSQLYRAVQRLTLRQKYSLVKEKTRFRTILDYGSGKGDFLKLCQDQGANVHGYEPDSDARSLAKRKNGLALSSSTSEHALKTFDAITMWHVLEHIPDPNNVISQLKERLSEDGRLIIAVPNHSSYDAQFYGQFWAAYDVPRHLTHFEPESFRAFANSHGFEVESLHPMWFDSTYVSILSEKYCSQSDNGFRKAVGFIRAVLIGAISNLLAVFNNKQCSSVIYVCKKAR